MLSLLVLISACGKETDADKVADAQSCLDAAQPADADACVSKVEGMESESAYLIRCAGKFVKEGFNNPTKIANALSNISGTNNSGATGSLAVMAALTFTAESTSALNAASAQQTFNYCEKANAKGLIMLAGFVQTATVLADIGLGDTSNLTSTDLQNLMGTLQSNPVAQEAVGTAVVAIYEANCATGTASVPGNYCEQFKSAVSSVSGGLDNPTGIGQQIMVCYNAPSTPGCTGF